MTTRGNHHEKNHIKAKTKQFLSIPFKNIINNKRLFKPRTTTTSPTCTPTSSTDYSHGFLKSLIQSNPFYAPDCNVHR
ncbi:hypothetical protein QJS10_CPA05g00021 [Acorus calamus]|uniref:Uncharacterized protein n=1 Tax=Acorus calamus TaxID=4465 RepID=A0AAV9ERG0_ACOCL|nr:hypothetical protein QJS10_CPA05g00021 [Acorus calamus]